jgi:hypothetical protein
MIDLNDIEPLKSIKGRCSRCHGEILVGADQCVVDDEMFSDFSGVPIGAFLCRWCFFAMNEEIPELTGEPVQKEPVQ